MCQFKKIGLYLYGRTNHRGTTSLILKVANVAPVGMGQYESVYLTMTTNFKPLSRMDATGATILGKPDAHVFYGVPMLI